MKTILITGGSGFLGSKIAADFQRQGWQVILALRKGYLPERLSKLDKDKVKTVEVIDGRINGLSDMHVDVAVHAATCYGRNGESWSQIAEANIILPLDILMQAEKIKLGMFINFDTFFNDQIIFEGNEAIYVKTKKIFSEILFNASNSLAVKCVNLRLEQVYGPEDNEKKFIPQIIKSLISGVEVIKLTGGEQKRDWIYADDVVGAVAAIVGRYDNLSRYAEFGIGTGRSISIKEVAGYLKEITNSKAVLGFGELPYRQGEIFDSKANISGVNRLGWQSTTDWRDGLKKTVLYYQEKK